MTYLISRCEGPLVAMCSKMAENVPHWPKSSPLQSQHLNFRPIIPYLRAISSVLVCEENSYFERWNSRQH